MGVLVVVETNSESEGVHRGPSQDALGGVTKPGRHSFWFMLLQEIIKRDCTAGVCQTACWRRVIARNCLTWLYLVLRPPFRNEYAYKYASTHVFPLYHHFSLQG